MSEPLRLELVGRIYQVTSRGNQQEDIYVNNADRRQWLTLFGMFVNAITGAVMLTVW